MSIPATNCIKLYYVANARLPSKKAYGIQIAKMCEAFIESGVDFELVIPQTHATRSASMRQFYGLRVDVPTVALPTVDWYDRGRLGYALSSVIFSLELALFFIRRRLRGERGIYYSIADRFSFAVAQLCGVPCVVEIHEPHQLAIGQMKRAHKLIATNGEIADFFRDEAGISGERILVEPNGVDLAMFSGMPSKEAARAQLHIGTTGKIALYMGRFYQWKGLEILLQAAEAAPEIDWYVVGGTQSEFCAVVDAANLPSNLHIAGEVAPNEVPLWLAAADTLLILGTKANETSYRYTAPMKIFEYMAAGRPVVASATLALKSIVDDHTVRFYEPDDAGSLAIVAREAIESGGAHVEAALAEARRHSWSERAQRIKSAIVPTI